MLQPTCVLAATPSAGAEQQGAEEQTTDIDSPLRWPTQVPVPRNTRLRELSARQSKMEGFTYVTSNYQFNSSIELDEAAQESIGELFECTFAANQAIAKVLPIIRAKKKRTPRNRFNARLVPDHAAYLAAGGPAGSVGVFMCRWRGAKVTEKSMVSDFLLAPLDAMGVSKDGKLATKTINSHTLVHEITHQFTCLNNLPIWANEGMSEYVGYVPYNGQVLDFDKSFEVVVKTAQKRQLDFPFTLEDFFLMSQQEMYTHMGQKVDTYMLATLCICYFVHLEGKSGVKKFQGYLKALLRGENSKVNVKKLMGRTPEGQTFQDVFVQAWADQGVELKFEKDSE